MIVVFPQRSGTDLLLLYFTVKNKSLDTESRWTMTDGDETTAPSGAQKRHVRLRRRRIRWRHGQERTKLKVEKYNQKRQKVQIQVISTLIITAVKNKNTTGSSFFSLNIYVKYVCPFHAIIIYNKCYINSESVTYLFLYSIYKCIHTKINR